MSVRGQAPYKYVTVVLMKVLGIGRGTVPILSIVSEKCSM